MLMVETEGQGGGSLRVAERIAIRYMNMPGRLLRDVDVDSVSASPQPHDSVAIVAAVRNTGQASVEIRGRVEIRDLSGAVLQEVQFGPMGLLPGGTRNVEVTIPARLQAGRYVAVPIVDFGGEYLAGGQATFTIPQR
jgi:hypothetical protein